MDGKVTFRQVEEKDGKEVRELVTSILANEFPADSSAYVVDDLNHLIEKYSGPKEAFFVAEHNNRIIGTCGVKSDGPTMAILRRFFVDPEQRGCGIGTGLLKEALGFCKTNGFREVVIRTSDRMDRAIRLCQLFGFREEGRWTMGEVNLVRFRLRLT